MGHNTHAAQTPDSSGKKLSLQLQYTQEKAMQLQTFIYTANSHAQAYLPTVQNFLALSNSTASIEIVAGLH